ncbi:hypothetical protein CEXT_545811 [Caerostris extrusa]|uniref:Uncharacterized protein n=1 Tax=Caerostris extrusa TaxID=172846 RepID=A0AAV4V0Y3_CAEEX|nr:hypothetical protein CEXT_545811 [Caerostris extrusa]
MQNSYIPMLPSNSYDSRPQTYFLDQVVPSISKEFLLEKPSYLNLVKKRPSTHIPSSPTNYNQPPTPDNPPPSPGTAEIGIHEKIHPVQEIIGRKLRYSAFIKVISTCDKSINFCVPTRQHKSPPQLDTERNYSRRQRIPKSVEQLSYNKFGSKL